MKTIVQSPTPRLSDSLDFYDRLGFTVLSNHAPTLVSDGSVVVEINPDRFARAGLKLYAESWAEQRKAIEKSTALIPVENGHLFSTPSGCWVYLLEQTPPEVQLESVPKAIIGNFAGLSLEPTDIHRALDTWSMLGFAPSMGSVEQGWVALERPGGIGVSLMKPLMCPHLFFNPSFTYFNGGKNLETIAKIRAAGVPITEEITQFNPEGIVDNVILSDPGGFGFFVFND